MKEDNKTIKLIAVYARVSTAKQEEEKTIKTQLSAVREFARCNGYAIVKEYIDDGWSGDILVRPQLDQLRQDAKSKNWEAVLAYDPDRLARRYSYQELVMDELREAGIEVLFVTTPTPKNGEEKILQGVKGLFAEYERAKIAERFRLGKLRVVKEGHVLGSDAPYGYRYVPRRENQHGYYEIIEDEAKVVRHIFTWIASEGLTIRAAVKRLEEKGIKPRRSKRGVWNASTLGHLLRNEAYIGEAHYGKQFGVVPERPLKKEKYRRNKKSSRRSRPRTEWIKIPVPPIINAELFQHAQEALKRNFELSNRNRKNEYLLSGKIWCTCGYRRAGEGPQHGKHLYYRCTQRVNTFPLPSTCPEEGKGVNARIADKLVWNKLTELMSSSDLLMREIERSAISREHKQIESVKDTSAAQEELDKLKVAEDRYMKAYGSGLLSLAQLTEYIDPLRERTANLRVQVSNSQEARGRTDLTRFPSRDEVKAFAKESAAVLPDLSFGQRRAIVRNVVDKVIGSQNQLRVYGYIPVDNTNNVSFCTSDRHGWNTIGNENLPINSTIPFEFNLPVPILKRGRIPARGNSTGDESKRAA